MFNPFDEKNSSNENDVLLINGALEGNRVDLERLILRHQSWIYNISIRVVLNPDDAEDVTQEILIKILGKLSTYDANKASFRTWLYRIATNHMITMKRKTSRQKTVAMKDYSSYAANIPDTSYFSSPETKVLTEDLKIRCMTGMLICLNRRERLVYVLGTMFGITDTVGSEIMDLSKANFRKILSRSREKVYRHMNPNCGLVNEENPCKCEKMMTHLIDNEMTNPQQVKYNQKDTRKIKDVVQKNIEDLKESYQIQLTSLFRDHPFYDGPDYTEWLRKTVNSKGFREIFRLH